MKIEQYIKQVDGARAGWRIYPGTNRIVPDKNVHLGVVTEGLAWGVALGVTDGKSILGVQLDIEAATHFIADLQAALARAKPRSGTGRA